MLDILPVEIWWKILKFLPGPDLCSVALVCSFFRQLTQEPALWSFVTINRDKIEQFGLDQLFNNYRMKRVKEIDLSYLDLTNETLDNVKKVVNHFEKLRMRYTNVTKDQKKAVLKASVTSNHLKDLDLDSIPLDDMDDELITNALVEKRIVGLNNTCLTYSQVVTLLMKIPTSQVTNLTLSGVNLSDIPPHHLCLLVARVEVLDLSNTRLTGDQLAAVLCECIWSTSIEEINLTGANFAGVSSQLLLDGLACLTSVSLCSAMLTRKQLFATLYSLTLDFSTLELLDLSAQDLATLPANLLAKSLSNLRTINLNYTKVTTEQLTAVLRSVARTKTVTRLELVRLDMTDVPVVDLIRPVPHIQALNLNYSKLTSEQTISLLTAASRTQSLDYLGLVRANIKPVPLKTLKKVLSVVRSVALNYTLVTAEQKLIMGKR